MKTLLRTIHEEEYSDKSKILGILLNYSIEKEQKDWENSFIYIYNPERKMYIFFNTIIDMIDYEFYGDKKIKCAYMPEDEFDEYYDAAYIEDKFSNILKW